MKRYIKKYQKYISPHHYISVAKRQPVHLQHMYAALFAGSVTLLLAVIILYFDYGFWRDKYRRTESDDALTVIEKQPNTSVVVMQSPTELLGGFFKEASEKIRSINGEGVNLLKGKDVYSKQEEGE